MKKRLAVRRGIVGMVAATCLGCAAGGAPVASGPAAAPGAAQAGRAAADAAAEAARAAPAERKTVDDFTGDVVVVQVGASRDLNKFNNQPHTVVLVLYQLSEPSVFRQMLESPEGRAKLLEAEAFDPTVLSRRRIIVQPGEAQDVVLDRMANARYLAAVGGFYSSDLQSSGRVVPVTAEKSGILFFSKPKPQLIRLELGKSGFEP
ncbi:MAG: type VI secretion lipoprotein TssJ [Deltaproteobacteria bacterium]|nr:type VI secretion lipoprotein TssJ [Deltaproteobacteria bacterium]